MSVMEHLLIRHPLLDGYAENINVAFQWAAEVAHAHGLTPEQAGKRLEVAMILGGFDERNQPDDGGDAQGTRKAVPGG